MRKRSSPTIVKLLRSKTEQAPRNHATPLQEELISSVLGEFVQIDTIYVHKGRKISLICHRYLHLIETVILSCI